MSKSDPSPRLKTTQEIQLAISLKFHHGNTLSNISLDEAVNAMISVWSSCQKETEKKMNKKDDQETVIASQEDLKKLINHMDESKIRTHWY